MEISQFKLFSELTAIQCAYCAYYDEYGA